MKNLLTLLLICFSFAAQAQVTLKPGIRAGVNFSNLSGSDFNTKTDFYAGGFMAVKLSRFYTMQPEINYSRQGAIGQTAVFDNSQLVYRIKDVDLDINYLSFGIINRFTFKGFDVHLGPTIDFVTSTNADTNSDVDFDFTAGLGYTFPMGITVEGRVKTGLIDVLESSTYNHSYSDIDHYNANLVFQLGLSYSFSAKGRSK
ncbi:outer membrane beta-barrel protein [Flavobacterium rhizosphaerae]|uniref:Outer membrane beta-barrel protein n=1 Tax=Flavobacterium rhizosphaerae TaxID=3163298 RepID=A0ABW8YYV9_9FLAO